MQLSTVLLVAMACAVASAATVPKAQPRAGADSLTRMPIIDGHNDLPWNLKALTGNQLENFTFTDDLSNDPVWSCDSCFTDIPRLQAGKVGAQFWVAYVSCTSQYKDAVEQTLEQIDVIKRLINAYPDHLQYADSAAGIQNAIDNGKIASLICVEGGHSIDSRLGVLRLMYEMGARYMTLTHSCNTPWGDSSPMDSDGANVADKHDGLTTWGKSVIKEMNRLGMMVDISHVAEKTMLDALDESVAPVIFSHSSAWSICNHHRNVKDNVLQKVKEKNGLVMVNFYSGFVQCDSTKNATMEDVVKHINHIRTTASVDNVGIGGDYDGVDEMPEGLEDVSKYPDLFERLANPQGDEPAWTDEELQKLSGRNLLRVMAAVEKVRDDMLPTATPVEKPISIDDLGQTVGCRTDVDQPGAASSLVPMLLSVIIGVLVALR